MIGPSKVYLVGKDKLHVKELQFNLPEIRSQKIVKLRPKLIKRSTRNSAEESNNKNCMIKSF